MSLDVLLEPIPERTMKQPCKIGRIVADLDEPYKSALNGLLETSWADGGLSDEQVRDRLTIAGLSVGATIINRHRRGRCTCESVVNG